MAGSGVVGDRDGGVERASEPDGSPRRVLDEERREVRPAEVLDDLVARAVIGDQPRHANASLQSGPRLDPPAPRVLLFGGIRDAEDGRGRPGRCSRR